MQAVSALATVLGLDISALDTLPVNVLVDNDCVVHTHNTCPALRGASVHTRRMRVQEANNSTWCNVCQDRILGDLKPVENFAYSLWEAAQRDDRRRENTPWKKWMWALEKYGRSKVPVQGHHIALEGVGTVEPEIKNFIAYLIRATHQHKLDETIAAKIEAEKQDSRLRAADVDVREAVWYFLRKQMYEKKTMATTEGLYPACYTQWKYDVAVHDALYSASGVVHKTFLQNLPREKALANIARDVRKQLGSTASVEAVQEAIGYCVGVYDLALRRKAKADMRPTILLANADILGNRLPPEMEDVIFWNHAIGYVSHKVPIIIAPAILADFVWHRGYKGPTALAAPGDTERSIKAAYKLHQEQQTLSFKESLDAIRACSA